MIVARPHGDQVAVAPPVADRLGVRVGDPIGIGTATRRGSGLIAQELDRLGTGLGFGPPPWVDMVGLDATRLIQPGSFYESRWRISLARPGTATAVGDRLVRRFRDADWRGLAIRRRADCVVAYPS